MGIVLWVVIGLVAGWLANLVMHSDHGLLLDLVLGLVGSLVGGFLASAIFHWNPASLAGHLVVAFVGAVLLITLGRLVRGQRLVHS